MAMGTGVHIIITARGSVPSVGRGSIVADIGTDATISSKRLPFVSAVRLPYLGGYLVAGGEIEHNFAWILNDQISAEGSAGARADHFGQCAMMSVLLVLRFSCSDLGWKLVCHVEQKFGKRDKVFNVLLSGRLFAFMKKSIRIFAETMSSIGQGLGDHSRLSKVLNLLLEITFVRTRGQPLSLRSVGPFLTSSFANSVLRLNSEVRYDRSV